jgi:hypothetical protein
VRESELKSRRLLSPKKGGEKKLGGAEWEGFF